MKFVETPLKGAYVIDLEKRGDDRGWFARFFCEKEYQQHNLDHQIVQANTSASKYKGTLRGMHYQIKQPQGKLVRVTAGEVFEMQLNVPEPASLALLAAGLCLVSVLLAGWLFWKLVRVMGRIQAGER